MRILAIVLATVGALLILGCSPAHNNEIVVLSDGTVVQLRWIGARRTYKAVPISSTQVEHAHKALEAHNDR